MLKHIIMWKLDKSYSHTEKLIFIKEFSQRLLQLRGRIPQLKSISVHTNSAEASDSNYDLLLDTSFENIDDLNAYASHPDHLAVAEYSKKFKKTRSCVDYEI
jgi:hypothetical protein